MPETRDRIVIEEQELTEELLAIMIRLSADWEAENSCYGYRKNEKADIEGNRIFIAKDGENHTVRKRTFSTKDSLFFTKTGQKQ